MAPAIFGVMAAPSPAHAGINQTRHNVRYRPARRPPRTRGSTANRTINRLWVSPSPAHAGINRPTPYRRQQQTTVPRARGDQPTGLPLSEMVEFRPPRTRGSTVRRGCQHPRAVPSPAHAGINRRKRYANPLRCPVPRARGDQPSRRAMTRNATRRPPRTRGSTVFDTVVDFQEQPSPAHAGINRQHFGGAGQYRPVPRARGDQPLDFLFLWRSTARPPRTRGSTAGFITGSV